MPTDVLRQRRFWVAAILIVLFLITGADTQNWAGAIAWIAIVAVVYWKWDAISAWNSRRAERGRQPVAKQAEAGTFATVKATSLVATENTIVRAYSAKNINAANKMFAADAVVLAKQGFEPTSQNWSVGQSGCLRFLFIGMFAFFVRPEGTLTVTYSRRMPA